jgi:HEPN domain-containing protein
MTTDDTGIRIGVEDDTIAFLLLFANGLHSYVLARASAHAGYSSSTLMLSQQAVELLIKAIRRLEHEKPEPVHNLVKLIEETKRPIPQKVKDLVAHEATR